MAENEKKNRAMSVLLREHKWENLILAILAIFAIELGVLLLSKTYLSIPEDAFIIGKYWKQFAWILVVLGAVSLILSVSSFFVPSLAEIKHINNDLLPELANMYNFDKLHIVAQFSNGETIYAKENN